MATANPGNYTYVDGDRGKFRILVAPAEPAAEAKTRILLQIMSPTKTLRLHIEDLDAVKDVKGLDAGTARFLADLAELVEDTHDGGENAGAIFVTAENAVEIFGGAEPATPVPASTEPATPVPASTEPAK